jgi:ribosomal peptide maturation radical SAM protein 1
VRVGDKNVLLVCAPFLSVVRPAFGLSLLHAGLKEAGISASIDYLNLEFAEHIGVDLHESIALGLVNTLLVGEWIFSELLNPHPDPQVQEQYFQELRKVYSERDIARLCSLRQVSASFCDREARRIAEAAPAIVGFSSSFQQNCASLSIAKRIKDLAPEITITFGGANCEGPMGRALLESFPQIDYVFSGESDWSFPAFVQRLLSGQAPYTTSPNVFSRNGERSSGAALPMLHGIDAAPGIIRKMDELPYPDFSSYFSKLGTVRFRDRVEPALMIESSRGCWWGARKHCKFCGLNGSTMTYRAKSPERIVREMDYLQKTWGIARFLAVDNIMDMHHIEPVFGVLREREEQYQFFYEIKSNLKRHQLATIAAGGVTWIQPGIESLNDEILSLMDKGVTALQNICLLRNAQEIGQQCLWSILYGFPGEKPEHYSRMTEWVPRLEHLGPPYSCVPIRLDRFSPYYERAQEFGFADVQPCFAYAAVYGLAPEELSRLAYFFVGSGAVDRATEYSAPLQQAVRQWQARHGRRNEAAVLNASDFDSRPLIEDTRSCALERWRCLTEQEAAVLEAFREPRQVRVVLQNFAGGPESFDRLVQASYLLEDGEHALSLVVDTRIEREQRLPHSRFPGGWVSPPNGAV